MIRWLMLMWHLGRTFLSSEHSLAYDKVLIKCGDHVVPIADFKYCICGYGDDR